MFLEIFITRITVSHLIFKTNEHLAYVSKLFPDGVIIRFNQGKRAQIEGDLRTAIQFFTPVEVGWTNFSHFCYWDLYWSHGTCQYVNLKI